MVERAGRDAEAVGYLGQLQPAVPRSGEHLETGLEVRLPGGEFAMAKDHSSLLASLMA